MKKTVSIFILAIILFCQGGTIFAAQLNGGSIAVTEQKVTVDVSTDDTGVILEVYDQSNKRVAGPTTTNGNPGIIKASITISSLIRGITYTLKGKDKNPNSGGDTFQTSFTTVNTNSMPTGTGTIYYSRENILRYYPPTGNDINKAFFRFTTETQCREAWQKDINDKFRASNASYSIGEKITECFTSSTVPTLEQFKSRMTKSYRDFATSVQLYYFTYKTATGSWMHSVGYDDLPKCQEGEKISSGHGIVTKCAPSNKPPTEPADWGTKQPTPVEDEPHDVGSGSIASKISGIYTLLAPIGDQTTVDTSQGIGSYFSTIFRLAIGLCGALAVVMIVIHAIQYMGTDSVFGKGEAKGKIGQAIIGLLIALGSFAILNTINPDLLGRNPLQVNQLNVELKDLQSISSESYELITGEKLKSATEYDAMARQAATKAGIPYCAMRVILQKESGGRPDVIGNDANVASKDIKARRDFVNSQKKYSGTTFTKKANIQESYIDKSLRNDDIVGDRAKLTDIDSLGLDWRFSHGIGLTQLTCQPKSLDFEKRKELPNCTFNGIQYTPKQLLNEKINLDVAAKLWGTFSKKCNGDIMQTWKAYASGSCGSTNAFAIEQGNIRTDLYNQCIKQNPS